eukprot:6784555-Pyramimonas_sp.AAC.1
MLLRPSEEGGEVGKVQFQERMRNFLKGDWEILLREAEEYGKPKQQRKRPPTTATTTPPTTTTTTSNDDKRRKGVMGKIKLRE